MGREWLYWAAGGGPSTRRRRSQGTGCMCAVFHLFDFNQFHLPLNHHHSFNLQEPPSSFKGVEAPRNSLELTEGMNKDKEEEILNFPVGINQIKTRASKSRTEDMASDCGTNSPGAKTPNLVARLMGLDLLPECSSPSSNPNPPTKPHLLKKRPTDDISIGARSLPETPRTSSSSRRSDVDHHHRLSLQINKERMSEEFMGKKGRFRKQDENSNSPGHYAKQIVKQVRESVSRRVGLLDITNINRDKDEPRRDQNLLIKSPKLDGESAASSCSRKCRTATVKSPRNSSSSENDCTKFEMGKSCGGAKKLRSQSLDKGMRNKKEEAFVRSAVKKSKKSPLSSELELLHISAPTLLPVKKDPSPPATKLPQKQVSSDSLLSKRNIQLSCHTSRSYNLPDKISTVPENVLPDNTNGGAAAPEYKPYVNKILKRAGIVDKFTPLTLGKWHTPSHPLDPSIFYYLELFHPATATAAGLSRRCNRKLIFQLVDELLADLLRLRFDLKTWGFPIFRNNDHFGLGDELCKRIEGFPAADCKVLEDIDSLVDNDLCKSPLSGCFQAEEERLVCEIEGEIVEWLVCETVSLVGVRTDEGRRHVGDHVMRCR